MIKRQTLIIGNWKMHKTASESAEFVSAISHLISEKEKAALAVPFTSLHTSKGPFQIGAQNMSEHPKGAYTGEISGEMVKEAGASFVLIGHSERRHIYGETDATIHAKLKAAYQAGLRPVLCIGETEREREEGRTEEVILRQLTTALEDANHLEDLILAYEPVWAIGTGHMATPDMAQEVHALAREHMKTKHNRDDLSILYGGSVKPDSIIELTEMPDIDGALVGGASLEPKSFSEIVNRAKS